MLDLSLPPPSWCFLADSFLMYILQCGHDARRRVHESVRPDLFCMSAALFRAFRAEKPKSSAERARDGEAEPLR